MKHFILVLFIFSLVCVLNFSSGTDIKEIVLEKEAVVVEEKRVSEQTHLVRDLRIEVDELYETTYKLNRLLFHSKEGNTNVRESSSESRATRSGVTHRRGSGNHLTVEAER